LSTLVFRRRVGVPSEGGQKERYYVSFKGGGKKQATVLYTALKLLEGVQLEMIGIGKVRNLQGITGKLEKVRRTWKRIVRDNFLQRKRKYLHNGKRPKGGGSTKTKILKHFNAGSRQ